MPISTNIAAFPGVYAGEVKGRDYFTLKGKRIYSLNNTVKTIQSNAPARARGKIKYYALASALASGLGAVAGLSLLRSAGRSPSVSTEIQKSTASFASYPEHNNRSAALAVRQGHEKALPTHNPQNQTSYGHQKTNGTSGRVRGKHVRTTRSEQRTDTLREAERHSDKIIQQTDTPTRNKSNPADYPRSTVTWLRNKNVERYRDRVRQWDRDNKSARSTGNEIYWNPLTITDAEIRHKRALPPREPQAAETTLPDFIPDQVKIVKLPDVVIKKYDSWRDILSSIGRGGANPFSSLMRISLDLYSLSTMESVDKETKSLLITIGTAIDGLTALIPDVNLFRIPFKFSMMISESDKTPDADELIGLLNDVNALKAYYRQDTFSVRYPESHPGQQAAGKTASVFVTDTQGKSHTLPVRWYEDPGHSAGGTWDVYLEEYRASNKEMLVAQPGGVYKSLDERNFIKVHNHYYPVEFSAAFPETAFMIGDGNEYTIPVERKNNEWNVINGRKKKNQAPATSGIEWEHRLLSAVSTHDLTIAEPEPTTGIAVIENKEFIKGAYGFYPVEYSNDLSSYIVKTGDGLDYPVKFDKQSQRWRIGILAPATHRYSKGWLTRAKNLSHREEINRETMRRNEDSIPLRNKQAGGALTINSKSYTLEADGLIQLRTKNPEKFRKLKVTLSDMRKYLASATNELQGEVGASAKKTLAEHFGTTEAEVNKKLIDEVKLNIQALQSALEWIERSNYSVMTLSGPGEYDASYYPGLNKIVLHDSFYSATRMKRLHILLHESAHARIIDVNHKGMSTPDYFYVNNRMENNNYINLARSGDTKIVHYDEDDGYLFTTKMRANDVKEAWRKFLGNKKKRIKILLSNPDSVAGLTMALGPRSETSGNVT